MPAQALKYEAVRVPGLDRAVSVLLDHDGTLMVDLRSVVAALHLAYGSWAPMLKAKQRHWQLEACHDWRGRQTWLIDTYRLTGWLTDIAPAVPRAGVALGRLQTLRRQWRELDFGRPAVQPPADPV